MEPKLLADIFDRLVNDRVADDVADLVLAACDGPDGLDTQLDADRTNGSTRPERPITTTPVADTDVEPVGAYLRSIAVQGFRGIGPEAKLALEPGPGLTLVVGRNGSGKSSFSEGLELLLTGDSSRWRGRTKVWREGWRNLHDGAATRIEAEVNAEDWSGPTTVCRQWAADAPLEDSTAVVRRSDEPDAPLDALGWAEALDTHRPFLSYNELGSMLDEGPSKLYDALAVALGLDDLVAASETLRQARLQREKSGKTLKSETDLLRRALDDLDDERAARAASIVNERQPDLDALARLLVDGESDDGDADGDAASELATLRTLANLRAPDAAEARRLADELTDARAALADVAGTDAAKARDLAGLLHRALDFHTRHDDEHDCPVCGRAGALDDAWRAATAEHLEQLRASARDADDAHRRADDAEAAARALLVSPPSVLDRADSVGVDATAARTLWSRWAAAPTDTVDDLLAKLAATADVADTVVPLADAAAREALARDDRWRPLAVELAAWVEHARQAAADAAALPRLKKAEEWLKDATASHRDERFMPIADQAKAIWSVLRQQSNVELGGVALKGGATQRRVTLDVTVDGVEGAALGVMSQGELHSLALSLFIPRATMPESPFRFVVIDDPVQAMDPARVDGLARVLADVAKTRQVVVFTHDDRLPEAVRRLQLPATVIEVVRSEHSVIELRRATTPVERAVDDAMAVAQTRELASDVAARVVPGMCRLALEAACATVVRRRRIGRGERHADVEELLADNVKLTRRLALALYDDPERHTEVRDMVVAKFGPSKWDTIQRANKGAHKGDAGDLVGLVKNSEQLAAWIEAMT